MPYDKMFLKSILNAAVIFQIFTTFRIATGEDNVCGNGKRCCANYFRENVGPCKACRNGTTRLANDDDSMCNPCQKLSYGYGCTKICNCLPERCDNEIGCRKIPDKYSGDSQNKDDETNAYVVGVFFLVVFLAVGVGFLVRFLMKYKEYKADITNKGNGIITFVTKTGAVLRLRNLVRTNESSEGNTCCEDRYCDIRESKMVTDLSEVNEGTCNTEDGAYEDYVHLKMDVKSETANVYNENIYSKMKGNGRKVDCKILSTYGVIDEVDSVLEKKDCN